MTESNQESNNYWLKLLNDKKISPELWNRFLSYHYPWLEQSLNFDGKIHKFWSDISQLSQKEIDEIREIEERYDEPPAISHSQRVEPCMDFSKMELDSEISFGRRILMGADFRNTEFKKAVDFSESVFLGNANFNKAKFLGIRPIQSIHSSSVASFKMASFEMEANFYAVQFPYRTTFDEARFNGSANFRKVTFEKAFGERGYTRINNAIFNYVADFSHAKFNVDVFFVKTQFNFKADLSEANFNSFAKFSEVKFNEFTSFVATEFNEPVDFDATEFNDKTVFLKTKFKNLSDFNNAKFKNTNSFSKASFNRPPKFYNTELHEDMNFSDIDWSGAELSYSRKHRQKDNLDTIIEDAKDAIRAWDRLAMIMSKQEKPAERHVFFRLKMRAQRQRDGLTFLTCLNLLFEILSDYGWSVGRAFLWWSFHIFLGAIILCLVAYFQINGGDWVTLLMMFWNSMLVSFSNSVSILSLGSEGGHLYGPSIAVNDAIVKAKWVFPTVRNIQAVIGPILLILLLHTLSNRGYESIINSKILGRFIRF